jgi:hypothetical protein
MDHMLIGSIIGALGAIGAGAIGVFKRKDRSSSVSIGAINNAEASESAIAIGSNIKQNFQSTNNYFNVEAPTTKKNISKPDPVDIWRAVAAAKPFEKHQIENNYQGVSVSWPVKFSSISPRDENWSVSFWYENTEVAYLSVVATIDIEKYPKIKIIDKGHQAWIQGRICWVNAPLIALEDNPEISLE